MKKAGIFRKIIKWCFSILCFLCGISYLSSLNLGAVLFILLAATELPVKPVDEMWERIIRHPALRVVKRILILILFVIAAYLVPTEALETETAGRELQREELSEEDAKQNAEDIRDRDDEQEYQVSAQKEEGANLDSSRKKIAGQGSQDATQKGENSSRESSQQEIAGQSNQDAAQKGENSSRKSSWNEIAGKDNQDVLQNGDGLNRDTSQGENAGQSQNGEAQQGEPGEQTTQTEAAGQTREETPKQENTAKKNTITLQDIPAYAGNPYAIINGNQPFFTDDELVTEPFETYSNLDSLGRCGAAYANICIELMPTEERGAIGMIKPSGWQTIKYDFVDGKYLYNRCHLIGFQLAGENANTKNLITGTRYLNTIGMLPFENQVAAYVERTDNHVLYRVTPLYEGNHLVANGVLMEAKSVEDKGEGICFSVFCYNVQPGVAINYADGTSREDGSAVFLESTKKPEVKSSADAVDVPSSTADASTSQPTHETEQEQSSKPQVPSIEEPAANPTEEIAQTQPPSQAAVSTAETSSQTPAEATETTDTPVSQTPQQPPVSTGYVLNTNTHKFHRPDCGSVSAMKEKNRQDVNWTKAECEAAGYVGCKNCNP